eukprot:6213949-Pleurochrysis_carterae.AAC.2
MTVNSAKGIVAMRPERAVITVSSQLHTEVCVLPIDTGDTYIRCAQLYAILDYNQEDGSSPHDTRSAGYGPTSALLPFSPPLLSSYDPPTLDCSSGLCYAPPRKA